MKTVFKEGMKVYDQVLEPNKKGTIVEIKEGCLIAFPVSVQFENCTDIRSYTLDGRYNRNGEQTLSTKPYKIVYEGFEQKGTAPTFETAVNWIASDNRYNPAYAEIDKKEKVFLSKTYFYAFDALRKLIILRDYYNEGWQPNWQNDEETKYSITVSSNELFRTILYSGSCVMSFKSREIRGKFLEEQKELLEIAKPLL